MRVTNRLRFKDPETEVNDRDIRMSSKDFDSIEDNKYIIITTYFHQYAYGVNGANGSSSTYAPTGGWNTRIEALEYAKQKGLKSYTRKGNLSLYGNLGEEHYSVKVIKKGDIKKHMSYVYNYYDHYLAD
jgi:hypothetical protein